MSALVAAVVLSLAGPLLPSVGARAAPIERRDRHLSPVMVSRQRRGLPPLEVGSSSRGEVRTRARPDGSLLRVRGASGVHGSGRVYRFLVQVEQHTRIDGRRFAAEVGSTLFSPRGWTAGGEVAFHRVSSGPVDFRLIIASRRTTDRLCAPAQTQGMYSCHNEGLVVINLWRWRNGAPSYSQLGRYRTYVVNHEVGHALGHHHLGCSSGRAPVMMQQTIGVGRCRANPWPLPAERRA